MNKSIYMRQCLKQFSFILSFFIDGEAFWMMERHFELFRGIFSDRSNILNEVSSVFAPKKHFLPAKK